MVNEIKTKSKACQNQRYVLGGHSQGGMVTVSAIAKLAKELPKEAMDRIIAVTMFGSPKCPQIVGKPMQVVLPQRRLCTCPSRRRSSTECFLGLRNFTS